VKTVKVPGLEEACEEIIQLRLACEEAMAEVIRLRREATAAAVRRFKDAELVTAQQADLEVQCKFWRQAAEHAVNGWNVMQDRFEEAVEAIRRVLDESKYDGDTVSTALCADLARIVNGAVDEGPPELVEELTDEVIELTGRKLKVVE
jgi:hypothetical protein